jgi:hypothetical protein
MKIPIAALIVVVTSGLSFYAGTRVGVTSFTQADAKFKASVTAGEIRLIEQRRFDDLKGTKELELDSHLANHGRYMSSNLKWLWPGLQSEDDNAITSAVRYRTSHPFEEPDLSKPENWNEGVDLTSPFVQDVMAGQKESQTLVKKVVETYHP